MKILKSILFVFVIASLILVPIINATFTNFKHIKQDSGENQIYKLLIITPKDFSKSLQPLVCHKNKIGMSAKLVTLCEIYKQMYWQGRDEQEKIKYFIKNSIEQWGTEYVLLIGGMKGQLPFWHLPVRYIHMENDWEAEIISDLYYADIYDSEGKFSTWDSDKDGIFGEWYAGEGAEDIDIDLKPDVSIGRLPCRNDIEVKIMVNKIIKYEKGTYGQDWFKNFAVFAGDTYPETTNPNWTGFEGEYYGDRAIENMTDFNAFRYYTSDETFTTASDLINALKQGCGFLYLVGHGSPKTWGNNAPNGTSFVRGLSDFNIHRLWNKDKLPVCVLSGCHDLQFDVSIFRFFNKTRRYHGEATYECLGWRLTRKIGGGSIATLGCTALGFTKEDKSTFQGGVNELEVEFFKQYGQNGHETLGDVWNNAVSWYIDTYPVDWNGAGTGDSWIDAQCVQTWELFGDPSLLIGGYPD